jgi:nucleoside 2-deoxyribosyltransferase
VFLPDAKIIGEHKKEICARFGLVGLFPLDNDINEAPADTGAPLSMRIFRGCRAMMEAADAVIAHLTPFRGPSADVGTVYEVGFMRALGRPIFGYATTSAGFTQRTLDSAGARGGVTTEPWRDANGMLIEQFGLFDNLMIEAGVLASGGILLTDEIPAERRWTDLSVFERCVRAAASKSKPGPPHVAPRVP